VILERAINIVIMKRWRSRIFTVVLIASALACYGLADISFAQHKISNAAALGDLDGDGDPDALLANGANEYMHPDTLWINQSGAQGGAAGKFIDSGLRLAAQDSHSVTLGDLDADGDLDALIGATGSLLVYLNSGGAQGGTPGRLQYHSQGGTEDVAGLWYASLGDLDGDGDLDAYIAICCGGVAYGDADPWWMPAADLVWLNDGSGNFEDSGQRLGAQGTMAAALGDLDGDGDLDAYAANDFATIDAQGNDRQNQPDQVWLNDGAAGFSDSGQRLGEWASRAVALGDLDADGDLDAFVGGREFAVVWLNDGTGRFTHIGQQLGELEARAVFLGDLDRDGDLDGLVTSRDQTQVWLNDGLGSFLLSGQKVVLPRDYAPALGDLDGDGDLDLFAGYLEENYSVWWNDGFGRLGKSWR